MRLMVSEVINHAAKLNKKEQIEYLRSNDSIPLRNVLKAGCCKSIEFLLPQGDPPYTPSQAVEAQGMFFANARKLYLFIKGGNDNLNQIKRETLYIQLLETVHADDAKILLLMKDKKLPLDANVVKEAFPDLNIDPVQPEKEVAKESIKTKSKEVVAKVIPEKEEKPKKKRGRKKKEET